jgi:hypothetical protein
MKHPKWSRRDKAVVGSDSEMRELAKISSGGRPVVHPKFHSNGHKTAPFQPKAKPGQRRVALSVRVKGPGMMKREESPFDPGRFEKRDVSAIFKHRH